MNPTSLAVAPACRTGAAGVLFLLQISGHRPFELVQFHQDRPGRARDGEPAVRIADPLDGKLRRCDSPSGSARRMISMSNMKPSVPHSAYNSRATSPLYILNPHCVSVRSRGTPEHRTNREFERARQEPPMPGLVLKDIALDQSARAVGDVAPAAFSSFRPCRALP